MNFLPKNTYSEVAQIRENMDTIRECIKEHQQLIQEEKLLGLPDSEPSLHSGAAIHQYMGELHKMNNRMRKLNIYIDLDAFLKN